MLLLLAPRTRKSPEGQWKSMWQLHVCVHTCVHEHVQHVHARLRHSYVPTYMHTCIYASPDPMSIRIYVHVHTCKRSFMYAHIRIYTRKCLRTSEDPISLPSGIFVFTVGSKQQHGHGIRSTDCQYAVKTVVTISTGSSNDQYGQ